MQLQHGPLSDACTAEQLCLAGSASVMHAGLQSLSVPTAAFRPKPSTAPDLLLGFSVCAEERAESQLWLGTRNAAGAAPQNRLRSGRKVYCLVIPFLHPVSPFHRYGDPLLDLQKVFRSTQGPSCSQAPHGAGLLPLPPHTVNPAPNWTSPGVPWRLDVQHGAYQGMPCAAAAAGGRSGATGPLPGLSIRP